MSATSRKRHKADGELADVQTVRAALNHYNTPAYVTRALVERIGFSLRGKRVLEPAAGEGMMAYDLEDAGARVDGVEIDSGRARMATERLGGRGVIHGDFLSPSLVFPADSYDVVITNPPYSEKVPNGVHKSGKKKGTPKYKHRDLALEFVQKSLAIAPVVAMLLRLNWAGSKSRAAFHGKHPADLVVLAKRPSYVGKKTDATEYAWWIWRRGATIGTWSVYLSTDSPARGRPHTSDGIKSHVSDDGLHTLVVGPAPLEAVT